MLLVIHLGEIDMDIPLRDKGAGRNDLSFSISLDVTQHGAHIHLVTRRQTSVHRIDSEQNVLHSKIANYIPIEVPQLQ